MLSSVHVEFNNFCHVLFVRSNLFTIVKEPEQASDGNLVAVYVL